VDPAAELVNAPAEILVKSYVKGADDYFLPPAVDEANDPVSAEPYDSLQEVLDRVEVEGEDVDRDDSGPIEVAPPVDEVKLP
jgi:hypothetical protein